MDMFAVQGGVRLRGRVAVSGAKNAALPIMAAVLASRGPVTLNGVPRLVDVRTLSALLQALGVSVGECDPEADEPAGSTLKLQVTDECPCVAEYDLVRKMRASICVLGPLVARRGKACVSLPGGCNIGDRPVDLHLKGLAALGAEIRIERGYIHAQASRLRGAAIYLGGPFGSTVTGTCNVMTAATLARGVTTIEAAACEPEVVDLGNFLKAMGARIDGLGTPFLTIEGVDELHGATHQVIPDRIEAATLFIAAAMTRGDVILDNVRLDHLTAVLEKLREIGVQVVPVSASGEGQPTAVRVTVPDGLRAADCIMLPYPGLPTDVQAQLMALLTLAPGISIVTDKVFPDRFMHSPELVRLGAKIRREGASAILSGAPHLSGATVMASDLRASAALVVAALAAKGESVIRRIYHLDRGYDRLDIKLGRLGARIQRLEDEATNIPASLRSPASPVAANPVENDPELRGPTWLRRERTDVPSSEVSDDA